MQDENTQPQPSGVHHQGGPADSKHLIWDPAAHFLAPSWGDGTEPRPETKNQNGQRTALIPVSIQTCSIEENKLYYSELENFCVGLKPLGTLF